MKKFSIDMTIREALNHPIGIGIYALLCTGTVFMIKDIVERGCAAYEERLTLKCAREIMDDINEEFTPKYEEDEN